jgi:hypothetical protein
MSFRLRPMQLGDIREWVEIVASDPLVASRYGPAIKLLPQAMEQALESEAVLARVTIAPWSPTGT